LLPTKRHGIAFKADPSLHSVCASSHEIYSAAPVLPAARRRALRRFRRKGRPPAQVQRHRVERSVLNTTMQRVMRVPAHGGARQRLTPANGTENGDAGSAQWRCPIAERSRGPHRNCGYAVTPARKHRGSIHSG
jgi:hypothetical protein